MANEPGFDMLRGWRALLGSVLIALGTMSAGAQQTGQAPQRLGPLDPLDPLYPMTAAPRNYRLEFENVFVRVIRATLAPRDHVPVHQHPTLPTVYVYLTDAGPTRFTHITPSYTILREPVRAGGVRYNRNAHIETHVVDNLSDIASEYLRIELKTTPDNPHPDARISPDDTRPVEDAQVRISRHVCAAGAICDAPTRPAVVVSWTDRTVAWFEPGVTAAVRNSTPSAVRQIWIELKTQPVK
jgi:hypothetical protein